MLLDIALNLWWWVAITIAEAFAFGKEIYDRYWGREKKFDWKDLLADQLGFIIAWSLLNLTIIIIIWFWNRG